VIEELRRRRILDLLVVLAEGALTLAGAGSAFGAEHHPPKFGVHSTQCSSDSNQPNCPGSH
jgi:hypothetical protein